MSAPALRALAQRDPVVVWPFGALEQHGPHLPVSTDLLIARGVLRRALETLSGDFPVVVLPEQSTGTSLEHVGRAGTLSLRAGTLFDTVRDTGGSLARHGFRRLVLFNTHGGNKHVLDQAALSLRADHGLLVVKAHSFRFPRPEGASLPEEEWRHGLHGGAVETAILLHLHPELVDREAIARFPSLGEDLEDRLTHLSPEGAASFAWLAGDLAREGVCGDARLATADLGAVLVGHYATFLADVLRDARAFPLDRLDRGS